MNQFKKLVTKWKTEADSLNDDLQTISVLRACALELEMEIERLNKEKVKELSLPKNMPTPKTLDEAIAHALLFGPLDQIRERSYVVLKDFMSQKFATAIMRAGHEGDVKTETILQELFTKLTCK